jgi:hypothetical protein
MKIIFWPIAALPNGRVNTPPFIDGERISYDGITYDLTPLEEGATIEIGEPFLDPVTRVNGQVVVRLLYFYDASTIESEQPFDITTKVYEIANGECPCPMLRKKLEPQQEVSDERAS